MVRFLGGVTIDGYNYYEISDQGNVRSKDKMIVTVNGNSYIKRGQLLKHKKHKDGYRFVTISDKGVKSNFYVHRLVASAFILNPDRKPVVNHLDGNKRNNCVENLEWVTSKQNALHAYKNNLLYKIEHLKPTSQAILNTETNICYNTIKKAAKAIERNYTVVREILNGKRNGKLPLEYCDCCK